jgi:hypothetical protein
MINLLKNKKLEENLENKTKAEINPDSLNLEETENLNKVNINRYKDPYGLSVGKMRLGLWLISNRRNFLSAFLALLILISFIAWSFFLYNFAFYIFKGMEDDQNLINSFSQILIPDSTLQNMSAYNLEFSKVKVFSLGNNKYDFLLKITNPNKNHFAHFNYFFKSNEDEFGHSSSFILPNESKYIMSLGIPGPSSYKNVNLELDDFKWERITNKNFPNWDEFSKNRLNITVNEEKFLAGQSNNLSDKINLNKLSFKAQNNTAYNYWDFNFKIILLENSREVAANIYKASNFMSEDEIEGEIIWPGSVPRSTEILIMPEIDITEKDIYISIDGEGGQSK